MSSGRFHMPIPERPEGDTEGRYGLRLSDREVPIETGETTIGRSEDCHIVVGEGLVSRLHARVVLEHGRPYIEDLASANGTFVNQVRLHGRAQLFEGDHIFIGTCEMEVFRVVDEDRPTIPVLEPPPTRRSTPGSGFDASPPPSSKPVVARRGSSARALTQPPDTNPADVEAFEHVGRLADKMFTMGRVDQARKILSGNLEEIVTGARSGHFPSGALVDVAGRYAVKLATETLEAQWVDMALELHLLAVRPLREETLQQLASLRAKVPLGSDVLIERYYETLKGNLSRMSAGDRMLCERVACLLPGLGTNP